MKLIDLDALGVGMANPAAFENRSHADGWNSLLSILQQAPVVDAEPVRHGQWIDNTKLIQSYSDYQFNCSVCDHVVWRANMVGIRYCPNCGAKMDGGA